MVRNALDAGQDEDELHAAERGVEDGHLGGYLLVADVAGAGVGSGLQTCFNDVKADPLEAMRHLKRLGNAVSASAAELHASSEIVCLPNELVMLSQCAVELDHRATLQRDVQDRHGSDPPRRQASDPSAPARSESTRGR